MRRSRFSWGLCVLGLMVAFSGCKGSEDFFRPVPESRRQYQSARQLYERGLYEQAGVAFRAWLADYHDSQDVLRPFVIYQLAECYRLTRDYAKAVQSYKKILDLYGSTSDPEVKKLVTLAQMRLGDIVPKPERRYGSETSEPEKGGEP